MARVYQVTADGVRAVPAIGEEDFPDSGESAPGPPPGWLQDVMRVRVMIGDPIAASIVYSAELPIRALDGQVCTTGNGVYMRFDNGAWSGAKLQFDDAAITMLAGKGTVFDKALRCVDALVARLNPLDYITGGSAGGQSVSFPSASDVLAFFKMKREAIASMRAASGNVRSVRVKPFPVGGVYG